MIPLSILLTPADVLFVCVDRRAQVSVEQQQAGRVGTVSHGDDGRQLAVLAQLVPGRRVRQPGGRSQVSLPQLFSPLM